MLNNNSIITVLICISSVFSYIQDEPPSPKGVPPPPGLVVPIDENIYLLAVAGIAFGIYTIRLKK